MGRVLVLCEHGSLNGGEMSLLAVVPHVRSMGYDIVVAAPAGGPFAEQLSRQTVRHVPIEPHVLHSASPIQQRRESLASLIQSQGPELVHANSLVMSRLSGPVARRMKIPSLGHLRDIMRVSQAVVGDLACHTRLVAVSDAVRSWYVGLGLPAGQIRVLYNGVDLRRFSPRPANGRLAAELGVPRDAKLVLSIGQIILRKGFDFLLDAAERVLASRSDIHFLIVGVRFSTKCETVEYERELLRRCTDAPLRGHVHFLGLRNDVDALLTEATMLVHPARQEPLGRVLLEAAAAGVAVIATCVGGTSEIFPEPAGAAVLVRPDDAQQLADAVQRVADDPAFRKRMGAAARRLAEGRFDAGRAAAALARQYAETLDVFR